MCPCAVWGSLLSPSDATVADPEWFEGKVHVTTDPGKVRRAGAACSHPQPWAADRQAAPGSTGTPTASRAGLSPPKGCPEANCKSGGGSLHGWSITIAEHPAGCTTTHCSLVPPVSPAVSAPASFRPLCCFIFPFCCSPVSTRRHCCRSSRPARMRLTNSPWQPSHAPLASLQPLHGASSSSWPW